MLDVQTKSEIKTVQGELKVNPVRIEDQWMYSSSFYLFFKDGTVTSVIR